MDKCKPEQKRALFHILIPEKGAIVLSAFWSALLSAVLFAAAVSVDSFATGFSYGVAKIRLPAVSILLISLICTLITAAGLLFGGIIAPILPSKAAQIISFLILCSVALFRLFDSMLRSLLRRHPALSKEMGFSLHGIRFILRVCVDHTAADADCSQTLSPKEAVFLAAALSLDGAAAGVGAGLFPPPFFLSCICSLLFTSTALCGGLWFGKRAAGVCRFDCGIAAGVLLLLMAVSRLF